MKELKLFLDKNGNWLTNLQLLETLKKLGANECEILYIHSSITFGLPNKDLKRSELLQSILDVFKALKVQTLIMPTFTFSFCNNKEFNPDESSSKMGALNEFFRKQSDVVRSLDPLMSVALYGENKDLVESIGHSSCGANSTFDKLRHRNNVKFIFFGPKIGDCLTYMHYLEWLYSVDYRYERQFIGFIESGTERITKEFNLFVRYKGVIPNLGSYSYEQRMYDKGLAYIEQFGDGTISLVDEKNAAEEYKKCLDENPYFFVDFENEKFCKDKTFKINKEMVAL